MLYSIYDEELGGCDFLNTSAFNFHDRLKHIMKCMLGYKKEPSFGLIERLAFTLYKEIRH